MIVTEKFIYIHLHKSAGTFVNRFVNLYFPNNQTIGYHFPARYIPEQYAALPIIGCVRNPWDFYISWYFFQLQKKHSNPLFMATSKAKTLDFNATMERLLSLNDNIPLLNQILTQLPDHFVASGMNIPRSVLGRLHGSALGLYSFLYQWMYADAPTEPQLAKTEELQESLIAVLLKSGVSISSEMSHFLQRRGHENASEHSHYAQYYSQEIRDRVAQLDQLVVNKHKYRFNDAG